MRTYCDQIEQDLPELREEALRAQQEMRAAAMREPTVSGQLRRAIAESGLDHRELAAKTGISPKALAEFLIGAAALRSDEIDQLASLLHHELKPMAT
jgi:cyanate lyase